MLIKFKYLFQERKELTLDTKNIPLLSVTSKGVVPQLDKIAKTRTPVFRKVIYPNDLILKSRSWCDHYMSAISNRKGSIATVYFVFYPVSNNISIPFMGYLFQNSFFKTIF